MSDSPPTARPRRLPTDNGCPVAECTTRLGWGRYRDRHIVTDHVACSCGWVGLPNAQRSHRAMVLRIDARLERPSVEHDVVRAVPIPEPETATPPPPPPPPDPRPVVII